MARLFYETFHTNDYLFGSGYFNGTLEELKAQLTEELKRKDHPKEVNAANMYLVDGRKFKNLFQGALRKKRGRIVKSEQVVEQREPIPVKETYRIPDYNLAWLEAAVAKLVRKATKLGTAGVGFEIVGTEYEKNKDGMVDIFHIIKPKGEAPKLDGWRMAATLQHEDAGNVIRSVPGEEIPASFRSVKPTCDHCNTSRWRKDTYLVRHDDGRLMQVGRSCIQDFLGGKSPASLLQWASWVADFDELIGEAQDGDHYPSGGYNRPIDAEVFMAYVAQVVILDGRFIGTKVASENEIMSTCSKALGEMFPEPRRKTPRMVVTSEAYELAEVAKTWISTLEATSDYEHNLKIIADKQGLSSRDTGIAASLIGAYKRATEKREKRERVEKAGENSKHFGTIGKRMELTLTLEHIIGFETMFGYMRIYKFMTPDGNVAVWKTGSAIEASEGDELKVKATVKDHDLYDGVKQTVLARLAVQ